MKKVFLLVIAGVIGISLLYFGCDLGISVNYTCITKTTSVMVNAESAPLKEILGELQKGVVGITWTWTLKEPEGKGVVVERSKGNTSNFAVLDTVAPIDSPMVYIDSSSIEADTKYYYRLSFLKDNELTPFDTVNLTTLSYLDIEKPDEDTLSLPDDILEISWHRVEGIDKYKVQIYKGMDILTDSLGVKPIYEDSLTSTAKTMTKEFAVDKTKMPPGDIYTIKVTAARQAEYFTDTSEGLKAFFRMPDL